MPELPEHVRREWEQGEREVEAAAADRARYHELLGQVEVLVDELRKRVGQTYTLGDLARAYADAERWAADALAGPGEEAPVWPRTLGAVLGAAFHRYARGASDYRP